MASKKKAKTTGINLEEALQTWRSLVATVGRLTEEESQEALNMEKQGARRKDVMLRLYGRFNRLRTERELKDLLGD